MYTKIPTIWFLPSLFEEDVEKNISEKQVSGLRSITEKIA